MSYIRGLYNPEKLYVYNERRGVIFLSQGEELMIMPHGVFKSIGRVFWEEFNLGEDVLEVQGARLSVEKTPNGETNELFQSIESLAEYVPSDWKVRLEYGEGHVEMWYVTAAYLFLRFRSPEFRDAGLWARLKWALSGG